jgi:hypothetical protein
MVIFENEKTKETAREQERARNVGIKGRTGRTGRPSGQTITTTGSTFVSVFVVNLILRIKEVYE